LIGATVALLLFGNAAAVYSQEGEQNKDHGKQEKQDKKDKKDKKEDKSDKKAGDAAAASQQQAQAAQAAQALAAQQAQQRAIQQQQQQQAAQAGRQGRQHAAQPQPQPSQANVQAQQQAAQRQQQLARQQEQNRLAQQNQINQQQLAQQQQQIALEQQRASQYQNNLDQQLRLVQAQNAQLEQQNRRSQYQIQQQYAQALQAQQERFRNDRNYDYNRDPYYRTASNYRYTISGQTRRTNRYGADVLRQAINYGYDQGYRAGEADRMDRWGYKYQEAFAYRDANYGYPGRYVSQSDYNYFFRQGFRRGYEDAYYRRAKYGRRTSGKTTIFSVTLSGILNLRIIR
jgi:hypothetical protein